MSFLKSIFSAALLISVSSLNAQVRNCGTMEHLFNLQQQDPQVSQRMSEVEQYTQQWVAAHPNGDGSRALYNIPVVVHVLYNTSAKNISDAQIQSQIVVMNKDYSKTNTDASGIPSVWQSIAATTDIQFCLATVDPNGNATTGIVRKSTTVSSFSTNDAVKSSSSGGDNAWNSSKYLNLWVCDLSSGLLGYAQFPGGPASTDGVVIDYQAFGTTGTAAAPFNLGRTATHEVGHWLNLYHIWGDDGSSCSGTDNVSDTPNQADENYGCPAFPNVSCSNGPNGDMWMNYMDYTDDNCMFMFTNGQKARMQSLFASGGARYSILSSSGCGTPPPPPACGTPGGLSATSVTTATATLNWGAVSGATSYNVRVKPTSSSTWTNGTSTSTSLNISSLTAGTQYEFQVQAVCSAGAGSFSASTFFTTTSTSTGCSDAYESNNTRATAKLIPVNTSITGLISSTSDVDWFYFSNSSTQKNIKVTLTNLPYDYDLYFYNSSGSLLAYSYNGSTTSETIKYNNAPVSTYYVKVIPYSGSSTTLCYTLTAQISATAFRESGEAELVVESEASHIQNLYPNPANDYFMVEFVSNISAELNCNIIDVTGRQVSSEKVTTTTGENSFKISTASLSPGIYLFRLNDGKENYTRRFVVER